jgi:hypothetical protein
MLDVRTDTRHKRIYLTFSGTNDVKVVTEGASRLLAAARALGPGFDLVNDISNLKTSDDAAAAIIARTQGELMKLHPRRIVRVVGAAGVAAMQLRRTAREGGATYTVATVASVAEADALLAKP